MLVIRTVRDMRSAVRRALTKGKKTGLVPTMGALHQGHLSLVRAAAKECGCVAVSIFVNPTQFGPGEDFSKYPRDFGKDEALLKAAGADIVFYPSIKEMYPQGYSTFVEETRLSSGLCGAVRPGHFRGVCTVVTKLFHIVRPDKAYFGQKDFQQVRVITQMVRDLNIPVTVKMCPIVRERDGLAMSSRNSYLSDAWRKQAPVIYRALCRARDDVRRGETRPSKIRAVIRKSIEKNMPSARLEYIRIVDFSSLEEVKTINKKCVIALAVYLGKTRLIDNIVIQARGRRR